MSSPYLDLLHEVCGLLQIVHGLPATVEFPGCVVVQEGPDASWWAGTVNPLWCADLMLHSGPVVDQLVTTVPSSSTDADRIAQTLAGGIKAWRLEVGDVRKVLH